MCTATTVSNLQRLATFIRSNKDQVIAALFLVRDVWQSKSSWLALDIGTGDQPERVACRAITTEAGTRFCFYVVADDKLVTNAYVAGGFMFNEETHPVVVGTLRQHRALPWAQAQHVSASDCMRRIAAQELQLA